MSNVQNASSSSNHKFPYIWSLANGYPANDIEYHGTTVMTTFACGGGSTMGYKLAGYDVVAGNDIDPQMAKVYKANHNPKQFFLCSIKDLLSRDDLPTVDVLDGSPPCSLFSTTGIREEGWQKEKMFREGQAKQILDDLFFDFIDLANKMQPKVVIAENVKGMLIGNAKWYTREVVRRFKSIGYDCQVFLLNAATMGVPQRRERVFFIAHKRSVKMTMSFNETPIPLSLALKGLSETQAEKLTDQQDYYWNLCKDGESFSKYHPRGSLFGQGKVSRYRPCGTLTTSPDSKFHWRYKRYLTLKEWQAIGSYPTDYDFNKLQGKYLIGMSVPPVMMAQVAYQVYQQVIK